MFVTVGNTTIAADQILYVQVEVDHYYVMLRDAKPLTIKKCDCLQPLLFGAITEGGV